MKNYISNYSKYKKELISVILFYSIFFVFPFIIFRYTKIFQDIAWFVDYFLFVFPLLFASFLVFIVKNKYKKTIYIILSFVLIYVFLLVNIYYLVRKASEHFGF
jgi:hypothetical protein